MTRPTRLGSVDILAGPLGSSSSIVTGSSTASNFAAASNGSFAFVKISTTAGPFQETTGHGGTLDLTVDATLAETPTAGNTLIAVLAYRGTGTGHSDPAGWTKLSDVQGPASDGGRMIFYTRASSGASALLSISVSSPKKDLYLAEWPGVLTFDTDVETDDHSAGTTMTTSALTPGVAGGVLFAGFNQSARNPSIALQSPFTESWDRDVDSSGPSVVFGYQVVPAFSGSYVATAISSQNDGYGAFLASFSVGAGEVWQPAPALIDGLPATYEECSADGDVIHLDVTVAQEAGSAILRTAAASNGTYSYSIAGTNDPAFAAPAVLDTVSVSELGSFSAQDVVFNWEPGLPYQYYEVSIDGAAARRFHELELFEGLPVSSTASNALALGGVVVQNAAGSNYHFVSVSPSAGYWLPHTDGTAQTAVEHGSMGATETIDVAQGTWHRGTLSANCAITVQGFTNGQGQVVIVGIEQNGTGGWDITWDADVDFGSVDDQPDQTANSLTWYLLWTDDGDTTIYGAKIGAGADTDELVKVSSNDTTAGYLNGKLVAGTGISLTENNNGSNETLTVAVTSGVSAATLQSMGVRGEILISDTPSTPLVFADLIQNDDQTDLLYADLVDP